MHASLWSQLRIANALKEPPNQIRSRLKAIRVRKSRLYTVQTRTFSSPATISAIGIVSSIDGAVARVIQGVLAAWVSVPLASPINIKYIAFEEDEVVVGYPAGEPGLESEDWIISIIAGLPGLLTTGLEEVVTLEWEVVVDHLLNSAADTDTSEVTPVPMGTPSDAGAPTGRTGSGMGSDASDGGSDGGGDEGGDGGDGGD